MHEWKKKKIVNVKIHASKMNLQFLALSSRECDFTPEGRISCLIIAQGGFVLNSGQLCIRCLWRYLTAVFEV